MTKKRAEHLLRREGVQEACGGGAVSSARLRARKHGGKVAQAQGEGITPRARGDRKTRGRALGGGVIARAEGGFIPTEEHPPVPESLPGEELPGRELTAYKPSWRERIAQTMMGDSRSPARKRLVGGLMGSTGLPGTEQVGLVDATPAGIALGAQEALAAGDPQGAALAAVPGGPGASRLRSVGQEINRLVKDASRLHVKAALAGQNGRLGDERRLIAQANELERKASELRLNQQHKP